MWDAENARKEAEKEISAKDIRVRSLADCIMEACDRIDCYKQKKINQLQWHPLQMRYAKNLVYEGIRSEDDKVRHLAFNLDCALDTIKYLRNKAQNE